MKKMWLSAMVIASTLALAATAQARGGGSGVLFDVNLYYTSTKVEDKNNGNTNQISDGTTSIYDIKLGYLGGDGWYFGGIYNSRSDSALNASGTAGSAMGASLGYFGSAGFFFMGHYMMNGTRGTYKEGSGIQVDLGYKAGVSGNWLVGGELSYRSMTFKKNETITGFESRTITEIIPMVSIGYLF